MNLNLILFIWWKAFVYDFVGTDIEASFPYRDVSLVKGPISKDTYDISKEELGR